MSSFVLRIFFHGLIAFSPNVDANGSNQLTALLVSTDGIPTVASQCVVRHEPVLTFFYGPDPCPTGCSVDLVNRRKCNCSLRRKEVSLVYNSSSTPGLQSLPVKPQGNLSLPLTADQAKDFSYIMNMNNLGYFLNREFLTGSPSGITARMSFLFNSLNACSLASHHEVNDEWVHPFKFRPIGAAEGSEGGQAIAQMLFADLTIDPTDPTNRKITIKLQDLDNTGSSPITLTLTPHSCTMGGGECIELLVTNERPISTAGECNDGVGRDFALFYNLVDNPPDWDVRPVPHMDPSQGARASVLEDPSMTCSHVDKNPFSRPICAMAVIYPSAQ